MDRQRRTNRRHSPTTRVQHPTQREMIALPLFLSLLPAYGTPAGKVNVTVEPTYPPVVFAVQAINNKFKAEGNTTVRHLAEIISAERQNFFDGQKLYLTLRLIGAPEDDYCKVVVWFSAWLTGANSLVIVNGPTCIKAPTRRQLPGGISDPIVVGTSLPQKVVNALNFAVCAVNNARNKRFLSVLGNTSRVTYTQQATNGVTFHFSGVPFLKSSCKKSAMSCEKTNLSTCSLSSRAKTTTCNFAVLYQSWLSPAYTMSHLRCNVTRTPHT